MIRGIPASGGVYSSYVAKGYWTPVAGEPVPAPRIALESATVLDIDRRKVIYSKLLRRIIAAWIGH